MIKRNKILLGTSALVIVLVSGIVFMSFALKQDDVKPQGTRQQKDTVSESPDPVAGTSLDEAKDTPTISYSGEGYDPETLEVKKGQTVRFTTTSEVPNWVASNPHPSHTDYPEFDTGLILDTPPAPGDEIKFTFDKIGSWSFHNHNQPNHTGTIKVTE